MVDGGWQLTVSAIAESVTALSVIGVIVAAYFGQKQLRQTKEQITATKDQVEATKQQIQNDVIGQSLDGLARGRAWTSDVFIAYNSSEIMEARLAVLKYDTKEALARDVRKLYADGDPQWAIMMRIPRFFQRLAWLDRNNLIEHDFAAQLWGGLMVRVWEFFEPTIEWFSTQKTFGKPNEGTYTSLEEAAKTFRSEGHS